jgi:hypothetical protein
MQTFDERLRILTKKSKFETTYLLAKFLKCLANVQQLFKKSYANDMAVPSFPSIRNAVMGV